MTRRPPPRTLILPSWLTPDFARRAIEEGRVRGVQKKRYEAIAEGRDWNTERGYRLTWEQESES